MLIRTPIALTLAFCALSTATLAGPLTPPSGTVTPTAKPLSEVEPRIAINQTNTPGNSQCVFSIVGRGSYYLTGNVTGESGKIGIQINGNDVTIDLNGFTLTGVSGSLDGISSRAGPFGGLGEGITVRNGVVQYWDGNGLNLTADSGPAVRVEDVTVKHNAAVGIKTGVGSSVKNCTAYDNGGTGISTGDAASLAGCTVKSYASGNGITVGSNSTLINCSADGVGSAGITAGQGSTLTNCAAGGYGINISASSSSVLNNCSARDGSGSSTSGIGISCASGVSLVNCTARSGGGRGFVLGEGCTLEGCSSTLNVAAGFDLGSASGITLSRCAASNNTGAGITGTGNGCIVNQCSAFSNGAGGVSLGLGASVFGTSAYQNTGNGISVDGASSVIDCNARLNTLDGILFTFRCQVRGNNSSSNTLAQFHATDLNNRIESNIAVSGLRGFAIDAGGNILARNSSTRATTNWTVATGNVGLIINAATNAAAFSGNSGGVAPGSTDPNVNLTN